MKSFNRYQPAAQGALQASQYGTKVHSVALALSHLLGGLKVFWFPKTAHGGFVIVCLCVHVVYGPSLDHFWVPKQLRKQVPLFPYLQSTSSASLV